MKHQFFLLITLFLLGKFPVIHLPFIDTPFAFYEIVLKKWNSQFWRGKPQGWEASDPNVKWLSLLNTMSLLRLSIRKPRTVGLRISTSLFQFPTQKIQTFTQLCYSGLLKHIAIQSTLSNRAATSHIWIFKLQFRCSKMFTFSVALVMFNRVNSQSVQIKTISILQKITVDNAGGFLSWVMMKYLETIFSRQILLNK